MDVLQNLVNGYNSSYHRSIKMRPINVQKRHQVQLRQRLYGVKKRTAQSRKLKSKKLKIMIGDLV